MCFRLGFDATLSSLISYVGHLVRYVNTGKNITVEMFIFVVGVNYAQLLT